MNNPTLQNLVDTALCEHTAPALALGFLRYEKMRTLNVVRFLELQHRNLAGERWDDMIDALVVEMQEKGGA